MATIKIPYLVQKGVNFHWQPSKSLREAGWKPVPLGADQAAAETRAREINQSLADWRAGRCNELPATKTEGITVSSLIDHYQRSEHFRGLRPNTQRSYRWGCRKIAEWCGDTPYEVLTTSLIRDWHQACWKHWPTKAGRLLTMLKTLEAHGVSARLLSNERPAASVQPKRIEVEVEQLWSRELLDHMVATADSLVDGRGCGFESIGTAMLVQYWIGQRLNDVLNLPLSPIANGRLVLRQRKGGRKVDLPAELVPELVTRIERQQQLSLRMQAGQVTVQTRLILSEATGEPYSKADDTLRHFSSRFAAVRQAAAVERPECSQLQMRMLRHTCVVDLAEHEATLTEIASITGHTLASVKTILERYWRPTAVQADNAFKKRLTGSR